MKEKKGPRQKYREEKESALLSCGVIERQQRRPVTQVNKKSGTRECTLRDFFSNNRSLTIAISAPTSKLNSMRKGPS